jgi:hypothetical protein
MSMPQMSVLAPPPAPGAAAEAPALPGAVPKLSMAPLGEKAPPPAAATPKALQIKVAELQGKSAGKPGLKPGSKPPMKPPVKPGAKPAAVLRKRPALGPVAKAGIGVLVLAVAFGAFFIYRIFFPPPGPVIAKPIPIVVVPKPSAAELLAKAATAPGKVIDSGQSAIEARRAAEQEKVDALANGQDAPTPTPTGVGVQVLALADLTKDVKVNNALIVAAPEASTAFRTFVANASIGGVFQGTPSKAIINGRIVREGQVVDSEMGVSFARVDVRKKMIYFKDASGAEVSKEY